MPRRPKLWIHRTRRFWLGVAILITLLAATLAVISRTTTATFHTLKHESREQSVYTRYIIELREGGLQIQRRREDYPYLFGTPGSSWRFYHGLGHGVRFLPSWNKQTSHGMTPSVTLTLFLPGTLPILLTCILWPLWIFRAERREQTLYESDDPVT